MIEPDKPDDEASRLATLVSLQLLDSAPEERFDRLTRIARRLFGTPIALVSLIDENRQWFKSCIGIDVSETSRAVSICGHAILGTEVLVVPDTLLDERFADNPLVTGAPFIRFYIGCPIKAPNGQTMGTLCVIDYAPRTVAPDEVAALQDLAHMVEREMAATELAIADELTAIPNRRGFTILAEKNLSICRRKGLPATLVAIDLDDFKQINDRFGHAEGDRALADFADALKSTFRASDQLGRLGGDEFVVLQVGTGKALAVEAMARLRLSIDALFETEGRNYHIAFSEGIVEYEPERHRSIAALLAAGDALMYRQKNAS